MKRLIHLFFRNSLSGFEFICYIAMSHLLLNGSAWGALFLIFAVFGQAAFNVSQKEPNSDE